MLRVASKTCLAGFIIVLLSLTACSKKQEVPPEISPLADENGLLRYVPADTPYIFAALEPLPDELLDKLEPKVDRVLASYKTMLRITAEQSFAKNEGEGLDEEQRERLRAIVDEVTGLLSVEALRRIGIARDSAFLFYGHGLLPVLRITLSDTAPFEAEIERLELAAGQALSRRSIGDIEYRYFEAEQARVVLALLHGQLVITAAPSAFDDSQLAELLGISLPSPNLAESGVLRDIAHEYGYMATQMGMISTERLADTFLEEPTGMNTALLALAGYDTEAVTDVCRDDFRSLAAVMPRIVFGARSISTTRIESSLVAELRPDIASGLMSIPAAVPGLGTTNAGLISFGMSFNLLEARQFVEARLEALEASPYRCERLAEFNSAAISARQTLNQPVPPVAYNFRGFLALVNDMQGFDPRTKAPPESIEASFVIGIEDPMQLLAFGQMLSPELAAMNLEPDGPAQRLELPQPAGAIDSAWIALSDDALAVSVDPDAETSLAQMLGADSAVPPPFISVGIDVARYYGMIGTVMTGSGNETDAEVRTAMTDIMDAVGDFYDRVALDVHFTKNGIEVAGDATLGD